MTAVSIDFETRSMVDLKATGVYPYAKHFSTGIWCMAYAFDDEEPSLWTPGMPFPERLMLHISQGGELRAWNAQFERIMWRDCAQRLYDFPPVTMEQWVDTAAEAAAMALPRGLDQCAKVTGVKQQKDSQGHALMLRMCRPRNVESDGTIVWWEVEEKRAQLFAYCMQDVRTERDIAKVLRRLDPTERTVYILDQRINDRGVLLDRSLAEAGREIVKEGLRIANALVLSVTGGAVESVTQVSRLKTWLVSRGCVTDSLDKASIVELLSCELTPEVRQVIEARAEAGRSSVAKIEAMLGVADPEDDRMRGLLLYHGANTGRWSGRMVQPQNFPRGEIDDIEKFIPYVTKGAYELIDCLHPPLSVVSSMLRAMLIAAPGHRLTAGDFLAIEARILNWLAGEQHVVAQFAAGVDIYRENAARIYKIPLSEVQKYPHRQTGKFQELGCGFGMGAEKAQTAAHEVYGVSITKEEATAIVKDYRDRHPTVVDYWYTCERAARDAVAVPGAVYTAGAMGCEVRFTMRGAYLWCMLPSGRPLCYAAPKIEPCKMPWGPVDEDGNRLRDADGEFICEKRLAVTAWSVNSLTKQWEKRKMYGGLWAENITQAVSRDIMAEAMRRVEKAGYPVVLTVHDEVVCEVAAGHGSLKQFEECMQEVPSWALGCPIAVEAWEGARYRK